MKKQAVLFLAGLFFVGMSACNSDAPATDTTTPDVAPVTTDVTTTDPAPVTTEVVATPTTISFDKMEHDFGNITDEGPVETKFTITNTGNEPLIITEAKGSCGCTVPEYPTGPVAPGESKDIKVSFNPSGKEGAQNKQVTIIANTEPQTTVLNIKSNITKVAQ